jgi:hypothetical protein
VQGFDVLEPQRLLPAVFDAACGGAVERGAGFGHFGRERRHARTLGRLLCTAECCSCGTRAHRAQRELRGGELEHCGQRGRNAIHRDASEGRLRLGKTPEQQEPAHGDQVCLNDVGMIGTRFERRRSVG